MTERLVLRLRRSLIEPVPQPVWPVGIRPTAFQTEHHAQEVHALLAAAYAGGGGYVEPFPIWWSGLSADSEYDPALCLIAVDERDEIAGVAQCWTSAFIKDLAVKSHLRRRGLGSALLLEVFRAFQKRGAAFVDLKVEANNPSGALRLYRSHGMREIESYRLA
jgi:ribosomal protein S18 acetylase RimI-like enzyme